MRIVLHGANGFLGRHLAAYLLARGYEVLGLVRRPEAAALLRRLGCEALLYGARGEVPPLEGEGLHVVLIYSEGGRELELVERLLERREGLKGLIYASGLGVEDPRLRGLAHFAVKARVEDLLMAAGVPYAILRPSTIIGPGDEITPLLLSMARRGTMVVPAEEYVFQPICITDACRAVEACIRRLARQGEHLVLPLVGPKVLSYKSFAELLAEILMAHGWLSAEPRISVLELNAVMLAWEITPNQAAYTFSNATADTAALEAHMGGRLEPIEACLRRMFPRLVE